MNFIAPSLVQRPSIGSDTPKLFHMCKWEPKQLALPPRLVMPRRVFYQSSGAADSGPSSRVQRGYVLTNFSLSAAADPAGPAIGRHSFCRSFCRSPSLEAAVCREPCGAGAARPPLRQESGHVGTVSRAETWPAPARRWVPCRFICIFAAVWTIPIEVSGGFRVLLQGCEGKVQSE